MNLLSSTSMEEAESTLDPDSLVEARELLGTAFSLAMEGLAAEIQSRGDLDGRMLGRELGVLKTYVLRICSISAGAGDRTLAQRARDAAHLIDDLEDIIEYRRLQSNLVATRGNARMHNSLELLRGRKRVMAGDGSFSSNATMIIGELSVLSGRLGLLLDKGAQPPLPPGLGRGTVVFGRDKELDEMVQMLVQPCGKAAEPEMMASIIGAAGIGKTTFAHMVFNDARVRQHFDVRCWVSVSPSSNKMELAAEILWSAQPSWGGYAEKMVDFPMLKSELSWFLASKRYLIVLDDVCNFTDEMWLDILSLRSADAGSRILLTSRMNPAPHLLRASQMYTVDPLDSDDCWALLKEHAFLSDTEDVHPQLQVIGREIAAKINGSPLAAKLLGGVLGDSRTTKHWMNIMETRLQEDTVFPALRLSYKNLPGHLKQCFAYCSLFPRKWKFDPAHLIRLWIAEGFVQPQGGTEKRIEDTAREYFDQLLSRSFFQELKLGPKTYYLVHDLLHDLAKSVAEEDCFRSEDGNSGDIPSTVHHLSVTVNCLPGLTSFSGLENMRTLLIQRSLPFSSDCFQEDFTVNLKNVLEKTKSLRVLDLSGFNMEELPSLQSMLMCRLKRLIVSDRPFSLNPIRVIRDLSVLSGRLGLLLDKGAVPSSSPQPPLPPDLGRGSVVFGREKELDGIVQPCGKAAEPEMMVSIVGAAGIGKTMLAQMVLNDERVGQHFDVRCWVSVSPNSDKMELTAEILRPTQPSWGGSAEKMVDFQMLKCESSMNHSLAMQHLIVEICRLELWDKEQVSVATKTLLRSIEQLPYSIQADTVCCFSMSRCQSESSSQDGYASSDGGDTRRGNEQQLHYPSHAHMDPGDVLLVLPGSVNQLEDIFRNCDVTFGPDYNEMLLQALLDNSDTLSSFFDEMNIPWSFHGSTKTFMDPSEHTEELIIMLKINTQVLCLMQQQLCQQSRPFEELKICYFALFAKCPIEKLLEIALCLSKTEWSATQICPMLLAYEALMDVLPLIKRFPSSESDEFFSNIVCNMREAFRGLFDHIKHFIQSNMDKHQGAAIHPMTCFLIRSMKYFSSHRILVQSTLAPADNSNSFGHLLYDVITFWKSVLTEHSNIYCGDLQWQYIFLLNNTEHFNRKTDGLLGELLSDSQIIEQHYNEFKLLFEKWIESYIEEACTPAKSCLTRNNWWGSPRPSLAAFTSKFNKTFDRQKTWKIPDLVLRQELKDRVQDCLLSDYRRSVENYSSSGLFCSCFEISSARDIYTPESLQTTVQGLYEA